MNLALKLLAVSFKIGNLVVLVYINVQHSSLLVKSYKKFQDLPMIHVLPKTLKRSRNRWVHNASYTIAIHHPPSVTMVHPINLWAISHMGGLMPVVQWDRLKCVSKVRLTWWDWLVNWSLEKRHQNCGAVHVVYPALCILRKWNAEVEDGPCCRLIQCRTCKHLGDIGSIILCCDPYIGGPTKIKTRPLPHKPGTGRGWQCVWHTASKHWGTKTSQCPTPGGKDTVQMLNQAPPNPTHRFP